MRATRPAKSRWARYMVALTVSVLAVGGSAAHAQSARGLEKSATAHAAKADRLVEPFSHMGVTRMSLCDCDVCARWKGAWAAARAGGPRATVTADFTITDTFAAEVSVKLLRWLQQHSDVVAISSDVEVHSMGISSEVSGTALTSDYSLRSTLGLESTSLTGAGVTVAVVDSGWSCRAPTTNAYSPRATSPAASNPRR